MMRQQYHEEMNVARQEELRANQKGTHRAALVAAAGELLREGASPSVPEAAERARVSRATAYRYFATQEALLSELAVTLDTEPVEQLLQSFDTDDVEQRLVQLLDTSLSITLADEFVMRSGLRVFLDQWFENRRLGDDTPVREGRRMRWLDQTLAPLQDRLPQPSCAGSTQRSRSHSASSRSRSCTTCATSTMTPRSSPFCGGQPSRCCTPRSTHPQPPTRPEIDSARQRGRWLLVNVSSKWEGVHHDARRRYDDR